MDEVEFAVAFFRAIEEKNWHALSEFLDDDFAYYGPTPDPVDKDTWLDFQIAVQKAFPDWAYNIQEVEKVPEGIKVTVHITGTHTEELDLPGFHPLPATNKRVELPIEHALLKIENGKITELRVEQQLHGSLPGLLERLGME